MLLSQAMLKGSEQRPQCFGQFFKLVGPDVMGSCVLGAAYEGTFGEVDTTYRAEMALRDVYPILRAPWSRFGDGEDMTLETAITIRNDGRQTREQIAAWLAEQGL